MSTRSTIFHHFDEEISVSIHVYEEVLSPQPHEARIEIETPFGVTNVLWPKGKFEPGGLIAIGMQALFQDN